MAKGSIQHNDSARHMLLCLIQSLLVATIAGYYYNLLVLDEKLNTSRRTVENWEENIRTMEVLKRAGKTTDPAEDAPAETPKKKTKRADK